MPGKDYVLSGLTVVDFSTVVAAPTTGRILADLGAEVIKVESIARGDNTRYQDAMHTLAPQSYAFTNCNSNKQCICIDVKTEGGRSAFLKLLEKADILITNVRYKSLKKVGLDYETLKEQFPRLIYAHFNGYGYQGPDADMPAYDMTAFWGRSGALLDGHLDDSPRLFEPAYGMGDLFCTGYFTSGILAALFGREKTGHGTMVSTSLLHGGIWANGRNVIPTQEAIGDIVPLPEEWNYNMFYRSYRCQDGKWLSLAFNYAQHFDLACEVFGLQDIQNDPRYRSQGALRNYSVAKLLADRVEATIARKPRDYWMEQLRARDMVYTPVMGAAEVSRDPQALENGFLQKVMFGNGTEVLIPSIPIQFSDYEVQGIHPGHDLGEDTEKVLREYGYSGQEVQKLAADGCVR